MLVLASELENSAIRSETILFLVFYIYTLLLHLLLCIIDHRFL